MKVFFTKLFETLDRKIEEEQSKSANRDQRQNTHPLAIHRHMNSFTATENMNGFKRMQLCRQALDALDRRGWNRSFHQRLFHEEYLKSCTRVFFKRDGPGAFSR